jgi:hypothetical protein
VLLTEVLGGLGLGGHANTNDMLVAAARTHVGLLAARDPGRRPA